MASASSHLPPSQGQFEDISRHEVISTAGVDREGRQVVVFFACRLPAKEDIDHERLLEYMLITMDNIVESDYTLVYFHHGLRSSNKPGIKWAIRAYRELDRSYKKNVKKMIIVHPTSFVRILLTAFKPVVSVKFGRKLSMMSRLAELESILYVDQLDIPTEVKHYDSTLDKSIPAVVGSGRFVSFSGSSSAKVFGIPPCVLAEQNGGQPVVGMLHACAEHIRASGMNTVGIFRRSANSHDLKACKVAFDAGEEVDMASQDVHIAACLIKLFFRELPEPLLTYDMYAPVTDPSVDLTSTGRGALIADYLQRLPSANLRLLLFILQLLCEVAEHEQINLMSKFNIATVFGPNLLWSNKTAASLDTMRRINSFLLAMMDNVKQLQSLIQV